MPPPVTAAAATTAGETKLPPTPWPYVRAIPPTVQVWRQAAIWAAASLLVVGWLLGIRYALACCVAIVYYSHYHLLSPHHPRRAFLPSWLSGGRWVAWNRVDACAPGRYVQPSSLAEIVSEVRLAIQHARVIRVVGSGHSFGGGHCAPDGRRGVLMNLDRYSALVSVDTERRRVTVQAGMRLMDLVPLLNSYGWTLRVLPTTLEPSVAGACGTATHGTGLGVGIMATQITGLEMVAGTGEVMRASDDDDATKDLLDAVRVSFGALGIITQLTLQCVPSYVVRATTRSIPYDALKRDFLPAIARENDTAGLLVCGTEAGQSVRVTTTNVDSDEKTNAPTKWLPGAALWAGRETFARKVSFQFTLANYFLPSQHFARFLLHANRTLFACASTAVASYSAPNYITSSGMYGEWNQQAEWFVPIERGFECLDAIRAAFRAAADAGTCPDGAVALAMPMPCRIVAADTLWLSPAYKQASFVIMLSSFKNDARMRRICAIGEKVALAFSARPHWGKQFYCGGHDIAGLYPKWGDFMRLRAACDPHNIFVNEWTKRVLDL